MKVLIQGDTELNQQIFFIRKLIKTLDKSIIIDIITYRRLSI